MANDGTLNFDTKIDSSGFSSGVSKIGSVAKAGIGVTTTILKGATAAVTALGGASIKVGSDFESAMSQVQAISGASGKELEQLKDKAKEMGATTKFSATESAEALNYMAMAGWKTEDMLGGLEGIMNLAAASGEDLATTSDIVTDALTAFGMSASDSGHFADILAAASSNANTNVGMMGETFKYVAPLAGALGYSAEDVATAVGLMANAGIKGSQAGTALRSTLSRLAKPTKESATAMEALGISITDSEGKMKPLGEVMSDMRSAFSGLTEDQKASYAAMLGGQEAMSGLLAIVNASEEDFNKLSSAIDNADGSAKEMAEVMQDNLQGQITILKSGLEGLGISIYETFQGSAKDVVKEAQGMVQQLQDAFNNGGLEGIVSAVGDVLSQVITRIAEAAPDVINMAVSLVHSFCDGLKSANGIGDAAASLITSLVTGIASCMGDILTTAIVLIGKLAEGLAAGAPQAVQAMADAVGDILEAVNDWLPDVIQAGVEILAALAEGIANNLPSLITQAISIVVTLAESLIQNLPTIIDAALQLVDGIIQGLVQGIPLLIEGAIQLFLGILEAIPVIIEQLLSALPDIITTIIDSFVQNIPMIIDGAIQLLNGIIQAIPTIVQAIADNLPQIITALVDGLTSALPQLLEGAITLLMAIIQAIPQIVVAIAENLPQIITAIASGLAAAIPEIFTCAKDLLWQIITAIPEIVVGIGEAIPDIISGIVNGLIGGIGAVWDAACELGSGILDGIKSFFGINSPSTVMAEQGDYLVQGLINGIAEMPAQLEQTLSDALNRLTAWGQQMIANIQAIVQNVVNNAEQFFSQLPGKIWTHLVTVVTKVTAWGQQMLSAATTAITNMISAIINKLAELPGKVQSKMAEVTNGLVNWGKDIVSKMTDVGKNIVTGIWNGISSGWDWLKGKVSDLANSLLDSAKSALGINSPSTKFRDQVGKWIMPGVGKGIEKTMPQALKDMKAAAGELVEQMQGTVDASLNTLSWNAAGTGGKLALAGAGTIVYDDHSMTQENTYNVPTATPSEVNKAQREAFRKMAGGVK